MPALTALQIDEDNSHLLELSTQLDGVAETIFGQEIGKLPPWPVADVDFRCLHEPSLPEVTHCARHSISSLADPLGNIVLHKLFSARVAFLNFRSVQQVDKASLHHWDAATHQVEHVHNSIKRREGDLVIMSKMGGLLGEFMGRIDESRLDALNKCCPILAREGFTVSLVVGGPEKRKVRPPDILAAKGCRIVRVFALTDRDVDSPETERRIRESLREGETLIVTSRSLRWRILSNLDRWKIMGAAVADW